MVEKETGFVEINGFPIHYDKFGTGNQPVLLIPGAIGTSFTDFMKQIEGPDAFDLKRFTFIVIELPGWGRSRPPKRPYGINVYDNDVDCAIKLMEHLNYRSYYVIGWSDGAKVAILTGIFQPSRVLAIVAIGLFVYCTKTNILPTIRTQKIDLWSPELRNNYLEVYGSDQLQSLWDEHINFCKDLHNKVGEYVNSRPDLKDVRIAVHEKLFTDLGKIRCPVLLVHGDRDPLIGLEQAIYCQEKIANCQLKRFSDGSHNVHQTHSKQFHDLVIKFFSESEDYF